MGRYDKIRVHDGTGWRQPSRIRVFANNAWQDLGENLSNNTRPLYVHNGSVLVRATLNKTLVNVAGESYLGGDGFSVTPATGYCYCPWATGGEKCSTWFFRATIRKAEAGTKRVLYVGDSRAGGVEYNKFEVLWLEDGRIQITNFCNYGPGTQVVTTSNAVGENQWVYLDITTIKGSRYVTINFNGVTTTALLHKTFKISNAHNWIGAQGLHFKDTVAIQGAQWVPGRAVQDVFNSKAFNATTMSGTTSDYIGADHVDTTVQEERWI